VVQVGGHHIFKQDRVSRAGSRKGEPTTEWACSDDGDLQQWRGLFSGESFGYVFCVGF